MSPNFFSFPSELRNRVYELLLIHQEPVDPWFPYHLLQELTPGLFRVNKTVHHETSSLFYAQNCFDLTTRTPEDVASFLGRIGRKNADYIRHIYVDFPNFFCLNLDDVALDEDSVRILAKIQSDCTNLSTLTTSLYSTNAMELRLDALDNHKIIGQALRLLDTRFRAISSLQEIIVKVYKDGPSDHIRREMKSLGWNISATEYVEEAGSDRFSDDIEDADYRWDDDDYDIGNDDDDDYDIDNDSDFWRRAGD
jgi:hypothetical protein